MSNLSQNYFLKCGFKYIHKLVFKYKDVVFKPKYNCVYVKTISMYDWELDGEIELEIKAFKIHNSWIILYNNKVYKINTIEELLSIELPLNYNENLEFIYIIVCKHGYKIGRTKNIDQRNATFNVKLPFKWNFLNIYAVINSKKIEKFLHKMLITQNLNGEWFELNKNQLNLIDDFIYQFQPIA